MSEVRPQDVLFRAGGRCLELFGVSAVAGYGKGIYEEVPETFTRADGTTALAGYYDHNGLLRFAAQNHLRTQRMDTDGDGIRDSLVIWFDDPRTNRALRNNDFGHADWFQVGTPVVTPNYVALGAINLSKIEDNDGAATEYVGYNYVGKADQPWADADGNGTKPVSIYWTKSDVESPSGVKLEITDTTAAGAVRFAATVKADGAGAPVVSGVTGTYLGGEFVALVGARRIYRLHFLTATVTVANEHIKRIYPAGGGPASETGDAIVALYQIENTGGFPSSPILPATTDAIGRAADELAYTPMNLRPDMDISILAKVVRPLWIDAPGGPGSIAPGIWAIGASALPSLTMFFGSTVPGSVGAQIRDPNIVGSQPNVVAGAAGSVLAVAAQWWDLAIGGRCRADGGAGVGADSDQAAPVPNYGDQKIFVGRRIGASQYLNAGLLDLIIVRGRRTRAELLEIP